MMTNPVKDVALSRALLFLMSQNLAVLTFKNLSEEKNQQL